MENKKNNVVLRKEKFAIIKAKKTVAGAFANIKDKNEITVIIEANNLDKENLIEIEEDYRLL